MATASLPERPDLDQLRTQARELQRSIRDGDAHAISEAGVGGPAPDFPLNRAQSLTARRYGFASWARLVHHVEAIRARFWEYRDGEAVESSVDRFLRLACLNYADDDPERWTRAGALLAEHPDLPRTDIAAAAVCGDVDSVREFLTDNPTAAAAPTGPHGWSPLMYLAYGRVSVDRDRCLAAARLLLDAGADPDDGRFFDGLPIPFTVLTGIFGGGESNPPPHTHAPDLARLVLAHGADPDDAQTLYNRMFTVDDDFLEVLFDFGLGTGTGGPWRRALPDLLDPPETALRGLLEWAIMHDQRERVSLMARHGVDITSPLPTGRTPIEVAVGNGHARLAALLEELGATMPTLDPVEAFIAAALAGDADAVDRTPDDVVARARRTRPQLVVWAAGHGRVEAVELLVANGFDIDAMGRADLPVAQPWQTGLHTAVERGDAAMATRLLALGADPTLRDARFDATPAQWAEHLGQDELAAMFAP